MPGLKIGDLVVLCHAGAYNSDERLYLTVTVREDGYEVKAKSFSWFRPELNRTTQHHLPFGFFKFRTKEYLLAQMKEMGIIPDLVSLNLSLDEKELEKLKTFDRWHRPKDQGTYTGLE